MHFRAQDKVVLETWMLDEGKKAPVWGGKYGYHIGVVQKVSTGDHDKSKHFATVHWSTGEAANFPESVLRPATADEVDISLDARSSIPMDNDIWMLIKTSNGGLALNVIECAPFGKLAPQALFVTGTSRRVLPSMNNSDYNLCHHLIMSPDFLDKKFVTLFGAVEHVYDLWNLPKLETFPLPIPSFDSIRSAAETAPANGPAVLFFHLPRTLKELSDDRNT